MVSSLLKLLCIACLITAAHSSAAQVLKTEDVIFKAQKDTITFGATITSPQKKGRYPAVVIVSGTGPQDRNGTMAGHPFFEQIAAYVSESGYVVLRMDDRGVGQTTGVYSQATTRNFAMDALEAVQFLKSYPAVDTTQIGLLGHSEGGAAIAIAAAQCADVKFLVSLAGLATNGLESLFVQNESLVNSSKLSAIDKKRSNEINRLMFSVAYQYAHSDSLKSMLETTYNDWKLKDDVYFQSLGIDRDMFRFPLYSYVNHATGPWYRYFVRYNAEMVLGQIDVPVLAINGDRDTFVLPENLNNWQQYTMAGRHQKVTTYLLESTNHLLQHCETCQPSEYASLGAIPSSTLAKIVDWIRTVTKS
ncbi:alpha/beta hydrolase [Sphingobacterium griseoflavum]|uniref:Xaa-Pro dipeptidyl-peptidase-like domain-containing protein n=1 Tax=Sphingobacterium griseoflavum TaxID=1474952 RepID=A0ABQ3HY08_9SPHI|nr:alpha/beta hydrolase [Sphingobacterium griseoflavum]GHE45929.1 hypothetical protein GCM10017764_31530 [Sphingobacterium griseoflavum]